MPNGDHCQGKFWLNYYILEYAMTGSVNQNIDPTHYSGYELEMYEREFSERTKDGKPERT